MTTFHVSDRSTSRQRSDLPHPSRQSVLHVAVVAYNGWAMTDRCLNTLMRTTQGPFTVRVLDNGSSDETPDRLADLKWPELTTTRAEGNLGVVGGRNRLMEDMLPEADDDDWIVFVDNDIEFRTDWRVAYDQLLAKVPDAAQMSGAGHRIVVEGPRRHLLPLPTVTSPVDVCGGHSCWVRAGALRAVGPLDRELGLFWHEDDDLSLRIRAIGGLAYSVPETTLVHHVHGSGAALAPWSLGRSLRNQEYLAEKWREAGWIDSGGWVASPDWRDYVPLEVRQRWAKSGILGAERRNELSASMWGLRQALLGAPAELRPPDALDRAVLRWWADALSDRTDAEQELGEAAAQALRRAPSTGLVSELSTNMGGSGFVRAADWSDRRLQRALETVFTADEEVRQRRDRHSWEAAKIYAAAEINGRLGRGCRALTLGAGCHEILTALASRVGSLTAVDRYADDARPFCRLPEKPEGVVGERLGGPLPPGLSFRNEDPFDCDLPSDSFDLVVAPFLLKWPESPPLADALSAMGRLLAPGGLVVAALDVAVGDDVPGESAVLFSDVMRALTSVDGLTQVGALVPSFDDEEFWHGAARQSAGGPVLVSNELWGRGTSAVIVLRKSGDLTHRLKRSLSRVKHARDADASAPPLSAVGAGERLRQRWARSENRRVRGDARDPIQMFWAGGPLGALERLSMRSFLAHDHDVHVYSYDELHALPAGVIPLDASEFIPRRMVELFRRSSQNLSGLANLFRYEMLHAVGGWWVDSDVVCLEPFDFEADCVIGSEPFEGRPLETPAIMKVSPGNRVTEYLRSRSRENDPGWAPRGSTGPTLVAEAVARLGIEQAVVPPEVFCPIGYLDWEQLMQPDGDLEMLDGSAAVHLWHEMWCRAGVSSDTRFAPTSAIEQLRRRYPGEER